MKPTDITSIINTIKEKNIMCIDDLFSFYKKISKTTFYARKLNELNDIKEAIEDNKIETKQLLKEKWFKSDNPTLQIALFKLICDDDERKKLLTNYNDITSKGEISTTGGISIILRNSDGI